MFGQGGLLDATVEIHVALMKISVTWGRGTVTRILIACQVSSVELTTALEIVSNQLMIVVFPVIIVIPTSDSSGILNMTRTLLLLMCALIDILTGSIGGCNGADSCCTPDNQCNVGEGDCDTDKDCQPGLTCGTDNCIGASFEATDDCCYSGELL